jgi:hypothetical protein
MYACKYKDMRQAVMWYVYKRGETAASERRLCGDMPRG